MRIAFGARAVAGALLLAVLSATAASAALLEPATHPKFVNPLPIPARIHADKGVGFYVMDMKETTQWLGLVDGFGNPLMTTVWGYGRFGQAATYPGPTLVARKNKPLWVLWRNELPAYNFPDGPGAHLLPVDPTLHMAHPVDAGIPVVTHLHGGHTESASDGLPEQWFTQNWAERGPNFVKPVFRYDNDQEAATLWYHDHALGITRLNVYAGLAGFYLLRDSNERRLVSKNVLPGGDYEIEVVIQDRMFTDDGALFYPSEDPEMEPGFDPLPPGPSVIAEFFGDFILVNGAAWPRLDVEPRKYRLRFLNGSDSRFYVLEFRDDMMGGAAQPFLQIGTDNGLLPYPVELTRLLLGPGERADLVVDFRWQSELWLRNFGPDDPFKGFNPDGTISDGAGGVAPPADPATTGQVMKFAVTLPLSCDDDFDDDDDDDFDDDDDRLRSPRDGKRKGCDATVSPTTQLRPDIAPLTQTGATRNLVLFEGLDRYGRLQPLLGTLDEGSKAWFEPITENPMLNDVEMWEVYNATEDAHPIHLHLVSFQIMNRESFSGYVDEIPQPQHDGGSGVGGKLTVTALGGDARDPEENERGWKDTAVMLPGEVTRVIAKFDRPGRYVWHCHILSHEDHEMMRPYYVGPMAAAPSQEVAAADYREPVRLEQNHPNPFNPTTQIRFGLGAPATVELVVYDVAGRVVRTLESRHLAAGEHSVSWNGRDERGSRVASGIYFYRLRAGEFTQTRKMVVLQ